MPNGTTQTAAKPLQNPSSRSVNNAAILGSTTGSMVEHSLDSITRRVFFENMVKQLGKSAREDLAHALL